MVKKLILILPFLLLAGIIMATVGQSGDDDGNHDDWSDDDGNHDDWSDDDSVCPAGYVLVLASSPAEVHVDSRIGNKDGLVCVHPRSGDIVDNTILGDGRDDRDSDDRDRDEDSDDRDRDSDDDD